MLNTPYEEQSKQFRERFKSVLEQAGTITTERTILLNNPFLETDVPHLWECPPCASNGYPNPHPSERIGIYRDWEKRKCITADMEVIQAYYELFNIPPPSFREAGPREYLYFDPKTVKVAIVTPGGIAPGINMVVHSLVCRHEFYGTKDIYGFRDGFRGLFEIMPDNPIKLNSEITQTWIHHGGTKLRTLREDKEKRYPSISQIVDTLQYFESSGIDILYVVGGNGSLTGAHEIWKEIQRRGLKIAVAGIPKTMDNDILWTWQSIGFTTAVAEATRIINTLHDEAESNNRICVIQLFGRDSGFVAANASLASGEVDAVLIPEENPIDINRVLDHLENNRRVHHQRHAIVVVAEGVDIKLKDLVEALRDRFWNPEIRRYDVFLNEPRHAIRSVPAIPPDLIYCRRLADLAVDNALAGFTDFMVSWWLTEYVLVPLELVVQGIKRVPTGGIFWKDVQNSTGQPSFRKQVVTCG